jgi:hypothetical protein
MKLVEMAPSCVIKCLHLAALGTRQVARPRFDDPMHLQWPPIGNSNFLKKENPPLCLTREKDHRRGQCVHDVAIAFQGFVHICIIFFPKMIYGRQNFRLFGNFNRKC